MKYYTETIPLPLAEKLKEKGMPIKKAVHPERVITYGRVFDWLMEKGTYIIIGKLSGENYYFKYECARGDTGSLYKFPTWHEAANTAIEKIFDRA